MNVEAIATKLTLNTEPLEPLKLVDSRDHDIPPQQIPPWTIEEKVDVDFPD